MFSEYTPEQEMTLLEQDITLLSENMVEMRQNLKKTQSTEQHAALKKRLLETETELEVSRRRLQQLHHLQSSQMTDIPEPETQPGTLHGVPSLPPHWISGRSPLSDLAKHLLLKSGPLEVSEGQRPPLVIQGSSGTGKSGLAVELIQADEARQLFSSGIVWINLGPSADILAAQIHLLHILGDQGTAPVSSEEATRRLQQICSVRACLVVLDDVQDVRDVLAFSHLGQYCQLLITSSHEELSAMMTHFMKTTRIFTLNVFREEEALAFLSESMEKPVDDEMKNLSRICRRWPAALRLILNLPGDCAQWLTQLRSVGRDGLAENWPQELMQVMRLNVDALGDEGEYYLALAVFQNYMHIPQQAIYLLWHYLYRLKREDSDSFIQQLLDKGLAYADETSPAGSVRLCAYHHAFLNAEAETDKLHNHLLTAYRRQCPHGWASGPDDGYFFEFLSLHLYHEKRLSELKDLLLDFDWLYTKLEKGLLHTLFNDFSLLEDDDADVELVRQALDTMLTTLTQENSDNSREKLAEQLVRYLQAKSSPDIQNLLNQAQENLPV